MPVPATETASAIFANFKSGGIVKKLAGEHDKGGTCPYFQWDVSYQFYTHVIPKYIVWTL